MESQFVVRFQLSLHRQARSPPTWKEPIPYQNAALEVAELQVHGTLPIPVHCAINKEKTQLFQERHDQKCSAKINILKIFRFFKLLLF